MTVFVKSGKLRLWFPVPLFFLRLVTLFSDDFISEIGLGSRETALALYRALKQAHRDFRGLELVHVRSADGEEVIVKL